MPPLLGPLLFIIYLNDLVYSCKHLRPVIYADDTALYTSLETYNLKMNKLDEAISSELDEVFEVFYFSQWHMANTYKQDTYS